MEYNKMQISLAGLDKTSKVDEVLYAEQLDNRELFLPEVIDDEVIFEIIHHIIRWNREDEKLAIGDTPKPISLYINSYGGDVIACFSILSAIKNSKTPVHTINLGKAFSAGGLVLMAGHKRYSYKDAVVLIHQGSSGAQGTSSQVIDQVEFQKRLEERIKSYILEVTTITEELYKDKWKEEFYLFGDEAIELGIVDELLV